MAMLDRRVACPLWATARRLLNRHTLARDTHTPTRRTNDGKASMTRHMPASRAKRSPRARSMLVTPVHVAAYKRAAPRHPTPSHPLTGSPLADHHSVWQGSARAHLIRCRRRRRTPNATFADSSPTPCAAQSSHEWPVAGVHFRASQSSRRHSLSSDQCVSGLLL